MRMCVCVSRALLGLAAVAAVLGSSSRAQDPGAEPRVLCDPADPAHNCPGPDCVCVPDTLEVVFDGASRSVLEYEEFVAGTEVVATVVSTTFGEVRHGWSFGVAHDDRLSTVTEVGIAGTTSEEVTLDGFDSTRFEGVQTCLTERCSKNAEDGERRDGGGWIHAHVLSFTLPQELPLGRDSLVWARYTLDADPGEGGTRIEFSDRLANRNSPRADINLTISGKSRRWETVTDGVIRTKAPGPEEKRRTICDVEAPANECPGTSCRCLDDVLEITFDGDSQSILEYNEFAQDLPVEVTVVMDTRTAGIQGWVYSVSHRDGDLMLRSVTTEDTDLRRISVHGFDATSMADIETCLTEECRWDEPGHRRPGGGWISGVVVSLTDPITLPVERSTVARASYMLSRDVGRSGSLVSYSDRLALAGSPRASPNVTIGGRAFLWTTTIDGWVKRRGSDPGAPFLRGDVGLGNAGAEHPADGAINVADPVRILRTLFLADGRGLSCEKAADADDDGAVGLADAVSLLGYLFLGTPEPPPPFGAAGEDLTPDELGCVRYP